MANTIIQLKHSTVTGNVPVALANGEISINSRDGKLFYATPSGVVTAFNPYPGPSGLDTEIQFNDAGSLGGSEKLTFNKTTGLLTVNGTVRANIFSDDGTDLLVFANNAYNTANSKTQVYQQNNAPSTAGATDFWIANTGVMYENFGNTTNPVWAEVGPTSVASNTLPGAVVATTLTTSNSVSVTYTPPTTINAAVQISAANTKGGTGYGDVLLITNSSTGATNPNKYFRLNSTGTLEIINSAYSAAIFTITDGGSLTVAGSITPTTWTAGQVIKDTMLSNSEITVSATTVATSTSDTDFISYSYTPVSASSYLIIHVHVASYDAAKTAGSGQDSYFSRIKVDGNEIVYGSQYTRDTYTFRTGVLFPLTGRYTNSSTAAKSITVGVRRDSADDSITITNSQTALWMRITEVAR